jgi:hypothetical protein
VRSVVVISAAASAVVAASFVAGVGVSGGLDAVPGACGVCRDPSRVEVGAAARVGVGGHRAAGEEAAEEDAPAATFEVEADREEESVAAAVGVVVGPGDGRNERKSSSS